MSGSEETNDEFTLTYNDTKKDSMIIDMEMDVRGGARYDCDENDENDEDDDGDDGDDGDGDEVEIKDRMIAKEAAVSRWASRAAAKKGSVLSLKSLSSELEVGQGKQVGHQKQQKQQKQKQQAQQINVICQTWRNVKKAIGSALLQHLAQHQGHQRQQKINNHKKFNNYTNNNNNNNTRTKRCVTSTTKTKLSETLAQIQISSALQSHLDRIGNTGTSSAMMKSNAANDTHTKIPKDTTTHIPRRVLDILPSGYDRTFAWSSSVQNRTRAFLLLDLGGVIKSVLRFASLTSFHTHYRSAKINIQPQFRVTLNPNIELLKLLVSLGVDLRCNTVDDVLAADLALKEKDQDDQEDENAENDQNDEEEEETSTAYPNGATLVDDAAKTRKPDGYFRRLFTTWSHDLDKQQQPSRRNHMEVAIDGPEEVVRISNAVKRFASRRAVNYTENSTLLDDSDAETYTTTISHGNSGTNMGPVTSCRFVLRLPSTPMNDDGTWERLILSTHSAAIEQGGELVGVSVNLSPWSQKIINLDKIADISMTTVAPVSLEEQETNQTLKQICHHLRIFRLLLLSLRQFHIRIDLTGFPSPLTRTQAHSLTHALSTIVSCDVTMEELEQVHLNSSSLEIERVREQANNKKMCSVRYTADVSEQLVADCGALCTRIIGVKRGAKSNSSFSSPSSGSLQEKKEQRSDDSDVVLNFYIDDGCYGSLGSSCSPSNTTTSSGENSTLGNTTLPVPAIKKQHMPVPLYGGKLPRLPPAFPTLKKKAEKPTSAVSRINNSISSIRDSDGDSKSNSDGVSSQDRETFSSINDTSNFVKATVWGPTCDGLDKVCESVLLPSDLEANRDWLVFPHLGCGGFGGGLGLGTAFNGFDPPDTAYCVLDYFSRGR